MSEAVFSASSTDEHYVQSYRGGTTNSIQRMQDKGIRLGKGVIEFALGGVELK